MNGKIFFSTALVIGLFISTTVQALEGKFRGTYVCEKLPTTRDILRAPLDLVVHENIVQFARPLFNLDGTRVVGSELAAGNIDANGTAHLTSEWAFRGDTAEAEYNGTLTSAGGTLTGTQRWTRPGSGSLTRTCMAALVPAPGLAAQSNPQ
jgi:hypothetical protein